MADRLTPEQIEALPQHFVHINRKRFLLKVYTRRSMIDPLDFVFTRKFRIAIGAIKHETPAGPFIVQAKARHPEWLMPHSDWVPAELQGTIVPPGPDNPIKEAFIRLTDDGVGIHGTDSLWTLGTAASHGCIRVKPETAIYLYNRLEPGDPVWIT